MRNDDVLEIHGEFQSGLSGSKLRIVENCDLEFIAQIEKEGQWQTFDAEAAKKLAKMDIVSKWFLEDNGFLK
jgi:hypothetical protein